ncbi:cleavage polyadenylation specificity factor [Moniliophthora roreri MCA 2997]|uniref:Cleavage polyadenylation specificity factor n=1 Tax=Moniliophthora roreri (strain MCA 2997) TaxID=1381753 RepID=V2YXJ7_MONRO|nr:cleavage polyadenylation specificity factor [Moniliophthora roreri MCA 2997]
MASVPADPLQTLQAALQAPRNSKEEADLLATLRESLEIQPAPIRSLIGTLLSNVVNAADSLLKTWVIDLLHFAICRSTLSMDQKTQMSSQVLDQLAVLLYDPSPAIVKVVVQCFTTVYPLLFRWLCINRTNAAPWNTLTSCKDMIIGFVQSPQTSSGVKISSLKFMQRVILVQTRGGSDPRLQNKTDPNISNCPSDHPFISVNNLEQEGTRHMQTVITMLYTVDNPDFLSALINSWANLVRFRPAQVPVIIATLKEWSPQLLIERGVSTSGVKSVEKAIRILLIHISRLPHAAPFTSQISEAVSQQAARMESVVVEEKKKKAAIATGLKRPPSEVDRTDIKRVKLENEAAPASASAASSSSSAANTAFLSSFDFTTLPASLITDLIVANLEAFTETELVALAQAHKKNKGFDQPQSPQPVAASVPLESSTPTVASRARDVAPAIHEEPPVASTSTTPPPVPAPVVKAEPVDPLQMDIDQDDLEYEPDRLNEELSGSLPQSEPEAETSPDDESVDISKLDPSNFKLPSPDSLSDTDRLGLVSKAVTRIWEDAVELRSATTELSDADVGGPLDMWMLLIVRMITRVAEPPPELRDDGDVQMRDELGEGGSNSQTPNFSYDRQDQLRQIVCDYIMQDFSSRVQMATLWLNEEWYNDRTQTSRNPNWRPNYEAWLNQVVSTYQANLDGKDRTFSRFLMDIPSIPPDILDLLRDLCVEHESPEKLQIGFHTLRGFVTQRPAIRAEALNVLLELTTHPEKKTRGAAINTVKLWVPHNQPMDTMIRSFALQILKKLQRGPANVAFKPSSSPPSSDGAKEVNGNSEAPDDLIQTPYLPERIELPAKKSQVLQHVELLFALSVKVPEFLDELFAAYGQMDETVQEAIQELITALIRSLGSSHSKLLTLMRNCPPGAESLALRVLTIFTENGRPSPQLVALVKALISERDLDARFLIPVIAEMDKSDIIRHLPRIVTILNGQPEPKNLVRSVFNSVVTTPPQTFGSVSSNLPRVRQSELLTPAELMVLLHDSEKEIGLKSAIEAIGICFSMTDVFRSEILAVVMQQIVDEPTLPVLFLRTVIQAVTTYKSLVGFVSTTLLSRLITKKIWTNPPLWEGFIRCAKVIAPASFGALLQLPKDQLRELVDKQPSLKAGLREYVTKKAPNKARVSGFLDIFADSDQAQSADST